MFVNLQQIIEKMVSIEKLTKKQMEERGFKSWPVWEKDVSEFLWDFELEEYCLILDGAAEVIANSKEYHLMKGDFVRFSKGLKCPWNIKQEIRKYYQFV